MPETLDFFDARNETLLGSAAREIVHQQGLWHRTFHCWVIRLVQGEPRILFQKRSASKKIYPSLWDVSAAGHLASGETVAQGVRELREELGLNPPPEALQFWTVRRSEPALPNGLLDREFHYVHFLRNDQPLASFHFQTSEISALLDLPLAEGTALFAGQTDAASAECVSDSRPDSRPISPPDSHTDSHLVTVRREDFVPRPSEWYAEVFAEALDRLKKKWAQKSNL